MTAAGKLAAVLSEIAEERARQDAKWGVQDLPDGTGGTALLFSGMTYGEIADTLKLHGRLAREHGTENAGLSMLEEAFEVMAETHPGLIRMELVQLSAFAVKWIQMIDRREGRS